jgi:hypothetical protein
LCLRFDYDALDTETRRFVMERAERIHNLARMTAAGIVQIGQYLTEVKDRLKHGQFLDWIEREFEWKERSAQNFMNVYRHVTPHLKNATVADLQVEFRALYLIAAPKTPEPVREQIIARAENGERVTFSGARAVVEHFVETGDMPDIEVDLPKLIEKRRRELNPPDPQPTREERRELEALRHDRALATARVVKVMTVIEAIERIAKSPLSIETIAAEIDKFDTPDKDWHQQARQAHTELGKLCRELKR